MHDSRIILLSFGTLFTHIWPWIAVQHSICKTCQNCPSWRCMHCMMAFVGAFTTRQQFMHPHCIVYYDKTWMKAVLTCFTKIIAEQPSLTQYERSMYNTRKINMLSFTDNNFMISFSILRDFGLNLGFLSFFLLTLYIIYHL